MYNVIKLSLMKNKVESFKPLSKWYHEVCIRLLKKEDQYTAMQYIDFLIGKLEFMEDLDFGESLID